MYFSAVKPGLFDKIVGKYTGWMGDMDKMSNMGGNFNRMIGKSSPAQKEPAVSGELICSGS